MKTPANPRLTREQLHVGMAVRIVLPAIGDFVGLIGKVEDRYRRGFADTIHVAGAHFSVDQHIIEAVVAAEMTPGRPAVLSPSTAQVFEAIGAAENSSTGKPVVSSTRDILTRLIGFDAPNGFSSREYGGRSTDGWFNQFIKVPAVKKALDALVTDGSVVKVEPGNRFKPTPDNWALDFRDVRIGYVTAEKHAQAHADLSVKQDAHRVAKLRVQAAANVAERHPDEVEAELARLLAEDS